MAIREKDSPPRSEKEGEVVMNSVPKHCEWSEGDCGSKKTVHKERPLVKEPWGA
jgi:hypothetical protein